MPQGCGGKDLAAGSLPSFMGLGGWPSREMEMETGEMREMEEFSPSSLLCLPAGAKAS